MVSHEEVQKYVGKHVNELPLTIPDWYPLVDDDLKVVEMLDIHDRWPDDVVIDASNDYARRASAREKAYHKKNGFWPCTVLQ